MKMARTGLETALFFETPEQICARVFKEVRPRTALPSIDVQFRPFANANSFIRMEGVGPNVVPKSITTYPLLP